MQSTPMQGLNFLEHRLIDLRLTRYWGKVGETTIADGFEKKMVYVKLY